MPLGVLEDTKLENVPGTVLLSELGKQSSYTGIDHALLKHDETGTIVLVPQPSDSPNDPYNWLRLKKELFTITFCWGCGCTGVWPSGYGLHVENFNLTLLPTVAVGPLLGAAFVPLAQEFDIPLNTFISGVQGGTIAAVAMGSLVFNCLAVKYGKRPVYLITTIGMMVACFWAAVAKSLASLVAARVLSGLCMVPFEALVPASIGDVCSSVRRRATHLTHPRAPPLLINLGVQLGTAGVTTYIVDCHRKKSKRGFRDDELFSRASFRSASLSM
ncbi:hypothetical protein BJX76DRAFT_358685 [Aspergillus varians]